LTSHSEDSLRRFLAARVAQGWMPGASWWVGRGERAISHGAVGLTALEPDAAPVGQATPFDLGSLTKPLVTALLLVLLERDGRLDLTTPLGSWVPEMADSAYSSCSLLSLASHTARLPAWWPLYLCSSAMPGYLAQIAERPPAVPAGQTLYSDLGYIVLGAVIERVTGRGLDRLFHEHLAGPLGLSHTGFPGAQRDFSDAAATERGNHYERAMAGELGSRFAWRERIPRGQVHDANAHGLGGVAGHAGLFGTAPELARIARELQRPGELALDDDARRRLLQVVPPSRGRTVGMVVAAHAKSAAGILADDAPGHTGFTGTSLWLDLANDCHYVLLTNRVHPRVPRREFRRLRRGFHRLALRRCSSAV
jgi:CubicO group peptidase (beta-lactamase class C family)